MGDVLIKNALALYNLQPKHYLAPQKGYRNTCYGVELIDGRFVNLIVYKREAGIVTLIKRANQIGDYVAATGLPARATRDPRIIRLQSKQAAAYASLYGYLPGYTIAWEAYTHEHLLLLGKTLSDLHASLQSYEHNGPLVADQCTILLKQMANYFVQPGVRAALADKLWLAVMPGKLDYLQNIVSLTRQLPAQQLHMDFVRGNVLFQTVDDKLQLSGILDFEKTAVGPPLFDIARTLAFLLVDCKYKTPNQIFKSFLHSGYARRGALPLQLVNVRSEQGSLSLLNNLVELFLMYDFYKFLRHNPYESLAQNEHFERTRARLLRSGLITAVNATIRSD